MGAISDSIKELFCEKCRGFRVPNSDPYYKKKKFLFIEYRQKFYLCKDCQSTEQREDNLNQILNG